MGNQRISLSQSHTHTESRKTYQANHTYTKETFKHFRKTLRLLSASKFILVCVHAHKSNTTQSLMHKSV